MLIYKLEKHGMIRSISRKGNCWEESWEDTFWHIEYLYNRKRRHAALGKYTPEALLQPTDINKDTVKLLFINFIKLERCSTVCKRKEMTRARKQGNHK